MSSGGTTNDRGNSQGGGARIKVERIEAVLVFGETTITVPIDFLPRGAKSGEELILMFERVNPSQSEEKYTGESPPAQDS